MGTSETGQVLRGESCRRVLLGMISTMWMTSLNSMAARIYLSQSKGCRGGGIYPALIMIGSTARYAVLLQIFFFFCKLHNLS